MEFLVGPSNIFVFMILALSVYHSLELTITVNHGLYHKYSIVWFKDVQTVVTYILVQCKNQSYIKILFKFRFEQQHCAPACCVTVLIIVKLCESLQYESL